jgi:hypothetical protein
MRPLALAKSHQMRDTRNCCVNSAHQACGSWGTHPTRDLRPQRFMHKADLDQNPITLTQNNALLESEKRRCISSAARASIPKKAGEEEAAWGASSISFVVGMTDQLEAWAIFYRELERLVRLRLRLSAISILMGFVFATLRLEPQEE